MPGRGVTMMRPEAGPAAERQGWPERWRALSGVWGVIVLFAIEMGGIYGGVFSPTEAAGIGAFGAFVFALLRGKLGWRILYAVLIESATTTAILYPMLRTISTGWKRAAVVTSNEGSEWCTLCSRQSRGMRCVAQCWK